MLRDDIGFPTVYCRIYRRKFLTLSNQTSHYICKCIRISSFLFLFFSVTSSEKVDKENRYGEFCIASLPYPGKLLEDVMSMLTYMIQ